MFDRLLAAPTRDQVIALAGIAQACAMVDQYARLGSADGSNFETAIYSLMQQNPASTEGVFKDISHLIDGFETVEKLLGEGRPGSHAIILRYIVGVLYIARKITGNNAMLSKIGNGIDAANKQAGHFHLTHTNVIANLADLYQNTISTLKYRIQVQGVANHLQQQAIANRIRCLLFSAVRSAILWQQLKGKRLQLMIHRRHIVKLAASLKREALEQRQLH
jgi:high frequency lysogenization protein